MSHLDHVRRLIEAGVFSYPGGGLDVRAAESAIAGAARLDAAEGAEDAEEDAWRRDEREVDGGHSGNEFPRLWPPRRAPETPEDAERCPRCEGSMVEPGTEAEGDWDSAAMRHHPYTGEPCTACHGTGKASGWLDRLAAGSLAAARDKFGPESFPETTPDAPKGGED